MHFRTWLLSSIVHLFCNFCLKKSNLFQNMLVFSSSLKKQNMNIEDKPEVQKKIKKCENFKQKQITK